MSLDKAYHLGFKKVQHLLSLGTKMSHEGVIFSLRLSCTAWNKFPLEVPNLSSPPLAYHEPFPHRCSASSSRLQAPSRAKSPVPLTGDVVENSPVSVRLNQVLDKVERSPWGARSTRKECHTALKRMTRRVIHLCLHRNLLLASFLAPRSVEYLRDPCRQEPQSTDPDSLSSLWDTHTIM